MTGAGGFDRVGGDAEEEAHARLGRMWMDDVLGEPLGAIMDDPVDAMNERTHPRRRSRAELDAIVDGFDDGSQLARLVAALRNAEGVEPTTASAELVEFVSSPRCLNGAEPSTSGTRSSMSGALYSSLPSRSTTARVLLVAGTAVVATVGLFSSGVLGRESQEVEVSVAGDPGSASGSPEAAGDTTSIVPPTTVSQGAKYIEAGDAGHLMVGVWEGALLLDALVPADGWEATVVEEAPALIQVSFHLGEGMVDVTIEPGGGSRWLVRIHDRGAGTEEEAYLDEYSSPTTPVDDPVPGPSTSVGPSTSIVSPSTTASGG